MNHDDHIREITTWQTPPAPLELRTCRERHTTATLIIAGILTISMGMTLLLLIILT